MRVAIDKNNDGIIDNIVEVESLELAALLFPDDAVLEAADNNVQIGWISDGQGGYIAPMQEATPVVYKHLNSADLIKLLVSAGGMTQEQAVACSTDADLAYFWLLLSVTPFTNKDNEDLPTALTALSMKGYLPNGPQAVFDAWPTE